MRLFSATNLRVQTIIIILELLELFDVDLFVSEQLVVYPLELGSFQTYFVILFAQGFRALDQPQILLAKGFMKTSQSVCLSF